MAEPVVERRAWPRISTAHSTHLACARVRPGRPAMVINVSQGGALIETDARLLPGTAVELQLLGESAPRCRATGRVLRCHVSMLTGGRIRYRGALMFTEPLSLPTEYAGNNSTHG